MQWTVLIPLRPLAQAKSRLLDASADRDAHLALVAAMRADTLAACLAAAGVARVVRVLDEPESSAPPGVLDFVAGRPGLNAVLAEAAAWAGTQWPGDGVAAVVGDLPSVRPDELADALQQAADEPRAYVPDADGTGTAVLTAGPGQPLDPRFGPGSAARHAEDAARIDAGASVRRDVDTPADLAAALGLGVGPATRAVLAPLSVHPAAR